MASAALPAAWMAAGLYGVSVDDSSRTVESFFWTHHQPVGLAWPPGHAVVFGTVLRVWSDLFWAPRVTAVAIGVVTVLAVAWLAHELFARRAVTLVAAGLAVLEPGRVLLSIAPLAEMLFCALALSGLACWARHLTRRDERWLLAAGIFFAFAGATRYEGWTLSAVLAAVALVRVLRREWKGWATAAGLVLIGSVFPVYWMLRSNHELGDPFAFSRVARDFSDVGGSASGNRLFDATRDLVRSPFLQLLTETWGLGLLAFVAAVRASAIRDRRSLWLVVPGVALVVQTGLSFVGSNPAHDEWRVAELFLLALLPFLAASLLGLVSSIRRQHGRVWATYACAGMGALVAVVSFTAVANYRLGRLGAGPIEGSERDLGAFLAPRIDRGAEVWAQGDSLRFINLQVTSGRPNAFHACTIDHPVERPDLSTDCRDVARSHLGALLLTDSTVLRDIYAADPRLARVAEFGRWSVFGPKPG